MLGFYKNHPCFNRGADRSRPRTTQDRANDEGRIVQAANDLARSTMALSAPPELSLSEVTGMRWINTDGLVINCSPRVGRVPAVRVAETPATPTPPY